MPANESEADHTFRVKDARGRSVGVLDPIALSLLHRYDVIPAEALNEIAREVGLGIKRRRLYVGYVCWSLGILGCAAVVLFKFIVGFRLVSLVGLAAFMNAAVIALGVFFTWRRAHRARFKHILGAFLRHLRCPHCGYDLRLLPTDPADGATVCPECGCAWHLACGTNATEATVGDSSS